MKVLVIGSGGREHALAWRCAQPGDVEKVYVAPGNAGTARDYKLENLAVDVMDFEALANFAVKQSIALTIVGPEAPLVSGIVDYFRERGLPCFGPSAAAARLEGSKAFAKDFLSRHGIPTAAYQTFTESAPAIEFIRENGAPVVIKADGLAAGKGVIVARTIDEAVAAVEDMLSGNRFGEAGHRVVIEKFLSGEEASFIAMVDGRHVLPMATSQDHKARDGGDTGPNTGGMGAYSPAPVVTGEVYDKIMQQVILPTVAGMAGDGNDYTGFLYAGLMISRRGDINVVEFNCRFGDPEAQTIMLRLESSLPELCLAALAGNLDQCTAEWDPRCALGVVLAAGGYPGPCEKGSIIHGVEISVENNQKIFHAGTAEKDGHIVTNGGRVLCVTALGGDVIAARESAYALVHQVSWDNMHYRRDIGHRAIDRT